MDPMERLRLLAGQIRDFFLALPPARRVSFAALLAGVVVGTIGLAAWVQQPQYRVLFSQLAPADASSVVEHLKGQTIPYRLSEDGTTIEVGAAHVYELRMELAAEGLPKGGSVGFEIFDQQTLGMTDFVQRLGFQRAMQGELERTIGQLSAVEAARVHLALPERSLFVSEDRHPSASVVVKIRPGWKLEPEQVQGVIHLVAASVDGLRIKDVTVVDTEGVVLSQDMQSEGRGMAGKSIQNYRERLEKSYEARVESMLERVLGPGHAVARVTAQLDMAQVEQTEEAFDPDGAVVRSERRTSEKSRSHRAGGVPGVSGALTNETRSGEAADPASEREDSVLNYELTKRTSHRVETMGAIERLSVAVLIDGVPQGEGDETRFVPRPEEELEQYRSLISSAVGIDERRGDQLQLTSVPFHTPELAMPEAAGWLAELAPWAESIWRTVGLLAVLLVALLVVRPLVMAVSTAVVNTPPREATVVAALEHAETVPGLPEPNAAEAPLLDLARQDPERTAMVIKQWVANSAS